MSGLRKELTSLTTRRVRGVLALLGLMVFGAAHGQELYQWDSYEKRIDSARTVQALGADAFGDSVSLQNGALSFSVTDVDLPGNNALPVRFTRTYSVSNTRGQVQNKMLADWSVQVPQLSGNFATEWVTSGPVPTARCSNTSETAVPPIPPAELGHFALSDFWQGVQMDLAGAGGGELLKTADGVMRPPSDAQHPYLWTTDGKVHVRCIDSIGAEAGGNGSGEGFEAITPDGTKYQFKWMAQRFVPGQVKNIYDSGGNGITTGQRHLPVRENTLYVTRVQDRFNNWVTYSYSNAANEPGRLTQINSSDGRQITIAYQNDRVRTVTAGGRQWVYDYGTTSSQVGQPTLRTVTLPDSRQWTINFSDLSFSPVEYSTSPEALMDVSCSSILPPTNRFSSRIGSIVHPSGATASFRVGLEQFGRSNVNLVCQNYTIPNVFPGDDSNLFAWAYWAWALAHKEVSGPGISTPLTWDYTYDFTQGISLHWFGQEPTCVGAHCYQPTCTDSSPCTGHSFTWVIRPDGSKERYKFGTNWQYDEGKLLRIDRFNSVDELLESESHTYDLDRTLVHADYPARYGTSFRLNIDDGFNSEFHRPELTTVTTRDGVDFSWAVDACDPYVCIDEFARPTQVTQSSTIVHGATTGYSRQEAYTYADDSSLWVLQRESVSVDGEEVARAEFYPATALPQYFYSYGQLKQTLVYRGDGTVSSVTDGNNHTTQLNDWYRGIPKAIVYHDASDIAAEVSYEGWITWTRDERDRVTNYHHDPMGRIDLVTPPAPGAPTTITYSSNTSAAYGLAAGHWLQSVSRGAYRQDTYYDGLWRPVLVREYQAGGTLNRYRVSAYDGLNREVFSAYPVDTLASTTPLSNVTLGVHRTFDGIGRLLETGADSELLTGQLITTIKYRPNFRKEVTNANGKITYFDFQAFNAPSEDSPTQILAPEAQTTIITRDVYGKPRSISRTATIGGTPITIARRFNYDDQQRLCKRIDPETGEQVFDYDLADNLKWSAHGLALSDPNSDACSRTLVPVGERINRDYDERNRLLSIQYPGATAGTTYTWFDDGQLETASRNDSTWTYGYNSRGLLETESLEFANHTRTFTHLYDALDAMQSTQYPNGETVSYAPNALGQPTQLGTYAGGALYHPDGSLAQVDFTNGIRHTRPLNDRLYPERMRYTLGSQVQVELEYAYDRNGNVLNITDQRIGGTDSQTFVYDDLDRLTNATTATPQPNNYGSALYTYDAFDNLRRNQLGSRDRRYQYSAITGRLQQLTLADNVTSVESYTYDTRGNLSTITTSSGTTTTLFDRAETLTSIVGQATYRYDANGHRIEIISGGQTRYPVYTQDGLLRAEFSSNESDTYYYLGTQLLARKHSLQSGDTLFRNGFEDGGAVSATTWYLADHLGSNVATANDAGQISERSQFAPFGERWETPSERGPGYAGHFEDTAGMTYMKARYYGPIVGRFISPDPAGVDGTTGGNFNRYWYANNNPTTNYDSDGRLCDGIGGGCGLPRTAQDIPHGETDRLVAKIGLGVAAAIVVGVAGAEIGAALLANPGTVNTISIAAAEIAGGDALGGGTLVVAGGVASRAANETLEIIDGVRRAKIADTIGSSTIRAEISGSGQISEVPVASLLSPNKSTIDVSTSVGMDRYMRVQEAMKNGVEVPPILVQPGSQGIPIRDVRLDAFGESF
ncbi:MAG: RHS repeat-associated core domain-containing protein [Lysobacterales bacterium]